MMGMVSYCEKRGVLMVQTRYGWSRPEFEVAIAYRTVAHYSNELLKAPAMLPLGSRSIDRT